ncbi:hypothetical protein [Leucobacter soli]|uniref:hypothetical protein n=1 Tax=Leucobacter soli TaxID=2812850 RepID=UPI00361CE250
MTLEEAQAALAACQAEITTVQAAQVSIGEGQQRVQDLAAELDDAVDDLLAALETDDGSTSGGSGSGDDDSDAGERPSGGDSGGETPGGASGGASDGSAPGGGSSDSAAGGSTATITAEQLLADQAAIAAAEAELKIARAQLALAELTSPVDGRVAAVSSPRAMTSRRAPTPRSLP